MKTKSFMQRCLEGEFVDSELWVLEKKAAELMQLHDYGNLNDNEKAKRRSALTASTTPTLLSMVFRLAILSSHVS